MDNVASTDKITAFFEVLRVNHVLLEYVSGNDLGTKLSFGIQNKLSTCRIKVCSFPERLNAGEVAYDTALPTGYCCELCHPKYATVVRFQKLILPKYTFFRIPPPPREKFTSEYVA